MDKINAMKDKFPPAKDIVTSILNKYKLLEVNQLHRKTYEEIVRLKDLFYKNSVNEFLENIHLTEPVKNMLKKKILIPVKVRGKTYPNFLEATARGITQAVQPISGNIAEVCATVELQKNNLKENSHFKRKVGRTDLVIYHPNINFPKRTHRVEIKNVSFRERSTRGLAFDGDSLFGFFNNPNEFTKNTIEIIDELCLKNSGYCYVPPETLKGIKYSHKRIRSNSRFGTDMQYFVAKGRLP